MREERELEEAVLEGVCSNTEINIPEVMVEKEVDNMIRDLETRLKYQGLDLETYYKYTNNDEQKVREYMRETSQKKVKADLVITEIAKVEKVEATDDEIKEKSTEIAKQYGSDDVEKMAKIIFDGQKEYLKMQIVNEKVIKMLVDSSKIIA